MIMVATNMPENIGPHRYDQLKNGSIRLFELSPSSEFNEDVHGTIAHFPLDDAPAYEALSYHWGTKGANTVYISSSRSLSVTDNLFMALRRLRHKDESRLLWIDAICINQSNLVERNTQVPLMRNIYSRAFRTLLYVGEGGDENKALPGLFESLVSIISPAAIPTHLKEALPKFSLPAEDASIWKSYYRLLEEPWFHRVWVMQEAIVSKELTMIYGSTTFPFPLLVEANERMRCEPLRNLLTDNGKTAAESGGSARLYLKDTAMRNVAFMEAMRTEKNVSISLLRVMHIGRFLQASDPRDHAFAVLGLSREVDDLRFRPDYQEEVEDIFVRYAIRFIELGHGIEMLHEAAYSETSGIPSWVPDWRSAEHLPDTILSLSYMVSDDHFQSLNSIYTASARHLADMKVDSDHKTLTVRSIRVDTITELSPDLRSDGNSRLDLWEYFRVWLGGLDRIAAEAVKIPHGETLDDVKWRTCIRNRRGLTNKIIPDGSLRESYRAYRQVVLNNPHERREIDFDPFSTIDIARPFWNCIVTLGRRFCVTKEGYFGETNRRTQPGDIVCVFAGSGIPHIIRAVDNGKYILVGDCYIHGIMDGEVMPQDPRDLIDIVLV